MTVKVKFHPLHDRLLVRRAEEETRSAGGIVLTGSAAEKPVMGEVLAVGAGKILENGQVRPMQLKVGNKIMFGKYSGTEVKIEGEELLIMREEDVFGTVS